MALSIDYLYSEIQPSYFQGSLDSRLSRSNNWSRLTLKVNLVAASLSVEILAVSMLWNKDSNCTRQNFTLKWHCHTGRDGIDSLLGFDLTHFPLLMVFLRPRGSFCHNEDHTPIKSKSKADYFRQMLSGYLIVFCYTILLSSCFAFGI